MKKIIICISLILLCVACKKKDTPEQLVSKYFQALVMENYKQADSYLMEPNHQNITDPKQKAFMSAYSRSLTYSDIILLNKTDSDATISAKITSIDLEAAFLTFEKEMDQLMKDNESFKNSTSQQLDDMMIKHINSTQKFKTSDTLVYLKMINNQWKIEGFENAATDDKFSVSDTKTESMKYLEADKEAGICIFQKNNEFLFMFCAKDLIIKLDNDFRNKPATVKYDVYKNNNTGDTYFEFVSIE